MEEAHNKISPSECGTQLVGSSAPSVAKAHYNLRLVNNAGAHMSEMPNY